MMDQKSGSCKNGARPMLSRFNSSSIRIISTLNAAKETPCCLAMCSAPSFCPILGLCCCCSDAGYISSKREASKYVLIRENSIEWNDPQVIFKHGSCFGIDPCIYDIKDNVRVLYYDDPMFDRITDRTRSCHECRTCLCGGRGERIQIDSPCCYNAFQRASFPCACVPVCCPTSCSPCAHRYEIYVADAQKGIYEIRRAIQTAQKEPLFSVPEPERIVRETRTDTL